MLLMYSSSPEALNDTAMNNLSSIFENKNQEQQFISSWAIDQSFENGQVTGSIIKHIDCSNTAVTEMVTISKEITCTSAVASSS